MKYKFDHWEDGSTNPVRNVNLNQDKILTATYVEVNESLGNYIFAGTVSAQAHEGETVTITITKPDSTTEILTAVTLPDKTYSVQKEYLVAGNYTAQAHGDADEVYSAWDSDVVQFTVGLTPRTGNLTVALA